MLEISTLTNEPRNVYLCVLDNYCTLKTFKKKCEYNKNYTTNGTDDGNDYNTTNDNDYYNRGNDAAADDDNDALNFGKITILSC